MSQVRPIHEQDQQRIEMIRCEAQQRNGPFPIDQAIIHLQTALTSEWFQVDQYSIHRGCGASIELEYQKGKKTYRCLFFEEYVVVLTPPSAQDEWFTIDTFFQYFPDF